MSQLQPTTNFRWIENPDCNIRNDSDRGLILEVDLEYPTDLHDLHNDYLVAPEKNGD